MKDTVVGVVYRLYNMYQYTCYLCIYIYLDIRRVLYMFELSTDIAHLVNDINQRLYFKRHMSHGIQMHLSIDIHKVF